MKPQAYPAYGFGKAMERPTTSGRPGSSRLGSRALGMGSGPVSAYGVPGTAANLLTPAPSTALRTATSLRPGSSRAIATEMGFPGVTGVPVTAERPITQAGGVASIRPPTVAGAATAGRRIQDKNYFLVQLRGKVTELTEEIEHMHREMAQHEKDNSTYMALQRVYESLVKEVQTLQASMTDFNVAIERLRAEDDLEHITKECAQQRDQNESVRRKVDQLFTQRMQKEEVTRELEAQISQLQTISEQKINTLSETKRARFVDLFQENSLLVQDLPDMQEAVNGFTQQIQEVEKEIRQDPLKTRLLILQEQRTQLEQKKAELVAQDADDEHLTVSEGRDKLLEKVRSDNAEIAAVEQQTAEVVHTISSMRDRIALIDREMEERKDDKLDKFLELQQREREMDSFINSFEETKLKDTQQNTTLKDSIVGLMERISLALERRHTIPTTQGLAQMQGDLEFKGQQLENSQTTLELLQQECAKRKQELENINTLDEKMEVEIRGLKEKMDHMREELEVYENLTALREEKGHKKEDLIKRRDQFTNRKDMLRQECQMLALKLEERKRCLAENETASQLESMEETMRYHLQNLDVMKEFIATRTSETNYRPLVLEVEKYLQELNSLITGSVL